METIKGVLATLAWAALLFAQHIVCFDVFDSNRWYLYALALILALAQMVILQRQRQHRRLLVACGLGYSALGVLKTPFTLFMVIWNPQSSWQLSLLCQVLDFAGAIRSFWLAGTFRKKEAK